MAFPSVYEMTNPLTTVRKQHFWEYFSGADITKTTTKTYNQADTSRGSTRSLYSNPNVSNGEGERVAVRVDAGHSAIGTTVNKVKVHIARRGTLSGNYEVTIRDGSDTILASASATANNVSTSYSTVELTLDNYVVMVAGYRVCIEYDSTARTANGLDFGTSSSAWESNITQQLYSTAGGWINDPDGAGAGRKFMFTFDSSPATSVLPPSRWTLTDVNGGTSGAMSDDVDGGYKILFSTQNSAWGGITFNNIRPFSHLGSVVIGDVKKTFGTGAGGGHFGLTGTLDTSQGQSALLQFDSAQDANFALRTEATSGSSTPSSMALDENWHHSKIEVRPNGNVEVLLTIDGTVEVTRTADLPTISMQPICYGIKRSTDAGDYISIRYCEAYNT